MTVKAEALQEIPEYKPVHTVLGTDEDVDASQWSTRDVAKWLGSLGLGDYAPTFAEHKVTGNLLHVLTEEHFRELGVALVGERALLLQETAKLWRGAVQKRRFRTIWEAEGTLYDKGCPDWCLKHLMCVPCCDEPDVYKLTGSTLYVTEVDTKRYKSALCATSKYTRAIDLSTIAGVSDFHRDRTCDCGCSADYVSIELDKEKGLEPVKPLLVNKGDGSDVAKQIQAAIEEAQSLAPASQAMVRM
mmetsp:Transcript_6058/g.19020  ORF Transcript_6058/g.19020 Transcript_6058/m.19020 type:complete len:245 (-) Transcript_6058:203-937(-)